MRLVSWNVARRVAFGPQVAALEAYAPDLVALQEVSARRIEAVARALAGIGLAHGLASRETGRAYRLKHGLVVASRWPLAPLGPPRVPFPESALAARVATPYGPLDLYAVHVPNGSTYGDLKEATFEAVFAELSRPCRHHRALVGDLNSPQAERPDGTVVTFGQRLRKSGVFVPLRDGGRKDRAERSVLLGLREHDLEDVFRKLHGYGASASSWRRFRLDHAFASASLRPVRCEYLDGVRAGGLSDHAALLAEFDPEVVAKAATEFDTWGDATPVDRAVAAFLGELEYAVDDRGPADERRRGQFRRGWERAVQGRRYKDKTLWRLTWNNLGYRAGLHFGRADRERIEAVYDAIARRVG